jgi:Tol biopolymer transport system component
MIEHTGNAFVVRAHRDSRDVPFTELAGTGGFGDPDIADGQLEIYQQDFRTPIGRMTRATKADSFSDFVSVGDAVNDGSENSGPSISHDQLDLYFYSNRLGPRRIFVARRASVGDSFDDVELVDLDIGGDSTSLVDPEISADGRHLYFGVETPESLQIFVASRCTGD